MAGKKSAWFKIATAGPTIDGREIKSSWLTDIAETYSPKEYTANIFKDHSPWYGNHGEVLETKTEKDGKGRLCLFARIFANELLLKLNAAGQALFTSIYVVENFANSGKAYLGHLAVTDNPASLGTEKLSFSAGEGQVFTFSDEIELSFDDTESDAELEAKVRKRPGLFKRLLGSQQPDEQEEHDMKKEDLEKLFGRLEALEARFPDAQEDEQPSEETDWKSKFESLETKFNDLQAQSEQHAGLKQELDQLKQEFTSALEDVDGEPGKHTGGDDKDYSVF